MDTNKPPREDGWDFEDEKGNKKRFDKFRFGINYVRHPQLLPAFWGSVNAHFQKIIDAFLISDGWSFAYFRKAALKFRLPAIFHCAMTPLGDIEEIVRHFEITLHTIFEAAKYQWLAPWRKVLSFGFTTCMKRQIGGLFLVYILLINQPTNPNICGRIGSNQRLHLDSEDTRSIYVFFQDVHKIIDSDMGSDLKQEVSKCFFHLYRNSYLEYSLLKDEFTHDSCFKMLKELRSHHTYCYFGDMKDLRDSMIYMTYQGTGNTLFKNAMEQAHVMLETQKKADKANKTSTTSGATSTNNNKAKFPPERKRLWTPEDVKELEKERDIAVIAFRLIEIIKFVTPPNPLTQGRLMGAMDETNLEEKVKKEIRKVEEKEKNDYDQQLKFFSTAPSRTKLMSKRGRHRRLDLPHTRGLKEYLGRNYETSYKAPAKGLKALNLDEVFSTEVISTYPELIFRTKDGKIIRGGEEDPTTQSTNDLEENPCESSENEEFSHPQPSTSKSYNTKATKKMPSHASTSKTSNIDDYEMETDVSENEDDFNEVDNFNEEDNVDEEEYVARYEDDSESDQSEISGGSDEENPEVVFMKKHHPEFCVPDIHGSESDSDYSDFESVDEVVNDDDNPIQSNPQNLENKFKVPSSKTHTLTQSTPSASHSSMKEQIEKKYNWIDMPDIESTFGPMPSTVKPEPEANRHEDIKYNGIHMPALEDSPIASIANLKQEVRVNYQEYYDGTNSFTPDEAPPRIKSEFMELSERPSSPCESLPNVSSNPSPSKSSTSRGPRLVLVDSLRMDTDETNSQVKKETNPLPKNPSNESSKKNLNSSERTDSRLKKQLPHSSSKCADGNANQSSSKTTTQASTSLSKNVQVLIYKNCKEPLEKETTNQTETRVEVEDKEKAELADLFNQFMQTATRFDKYMEIKDAKEAAVESTKKCAKSEEASTSKALTSSNGIESTQLEANSGKRRRKKLVVPQRELPLRKNRGKNAKLDSYQS